MIRFNSYFGGLFVVFVSLVATAATPFTAHAQLSGQPGSRFSIVGAFDESANADPATVSAQFTPATAERPALVLINVRLAPGWHTYSLSQPRGKTGGPQATKIKLNPSPKYQLLAPFRAGTPPHSRIDQEAWVGLELQEHEGEVTWYAPIELAAGVDPSQVNIGGLADMQVCKEQCIPQKVKFTARLAKSDQSSKIDQLVAKDEKLTGIKAAGALDPRTTTKGNFQADGSVVKVTGRMEPATVKPGQTARVSITVAPNRGWHIYAYAPRDDKPGSKPTLIGLESAWGLSAGRPATESPVKIDSSVKDFPPMHFHDGAVTWAFDVDVPADAEPGAYPLTGVIAYQACEVRADGLGSCEIPKGTRFGVTLNVGEGQSAAGGQFTFTPISYKEASTVAAAWADVLDSQPAKPEQRAAAVAPTPSSIDLAATAPAASNANVPSLSAANPYDLSKIRVQENSGSLSRYIALAFVGGLILNLMPCVLPVIGLKVMSFVEQAGKSRAHALVLNGWYSLGIISVFLVLGILAATIGFSWGGQFGNTAFNVTIAAVVFAMALSLLGVWEVPIPGFFGSGRVQDAAAQEGPAGAFLKGVVTTVLATPCTAPFMATAVAWAVSQSATTTLVVFASLGLGMASPYLLVGVFPELLRFLPKPGGWMDTFKQVTGFVLMGTVVFILTFLEPAAVVPTVLLLVGIGLACWLFAKTPVYAEWSDRRRAWGKATAVIMVFIAASFGWLYPQVMWPRFGGLRSSIKEGWDPFSLERLQQVAVDTGRTVLVDFSADWCVNCKVLENTVLHTTPVEQAIASSGAARMYADFTHYPPEIDNTIKALKSIGVPVIAIFPGDRPYEPIVFRGGYTGASLIEALGSARNRQSVAIDRPAANSEVAVSRQ